MKVTLGRCNGVVMRGLILLLAFTWSNDGGVQAAEAPVKLAIITEAADFARMADLLMVELSSHRPASGLSRIRAANRAVTAQIIFQRF
jgi:hypothetical protein